MVEIVRPANRDEWLAARRQDVTASVAGCLLGVHPYISAYQLWAEKSGAVEPDDADSKVLRRGRLLEPVAVEMLREDYPDWKIEYHQDNAYYRDPAARMGATPDAFAYRPDRRGRGVVQVKSVAEDTFRRQWIDPDTGDIVLPLWIAVQAIVEAELSESAWASAALLVVGRGLDLYPVDVPMHAGVQRRLRAAVREFWRMIDDGEHPPIDWQRDGSTVVDVYRDVMPDRKDLTGDPDTDVLVARYRDAKDREAQAKKLASTLRPQIIYALGNSEAGETASWQFTAGLQRREGHYVKPSETRVLRIKPRNDIHARF